MLVSGLSYRPIGHTGTTVPAPPTLAKAALDNHLSK